jgi:hypothetical protein
VSAVLPGDDIDTLRAVHLHGDTVELEVTNEQRPGTRRFPITELQARIADARGLAALKAGHRSAAAARFDEAIALDGVLDDAVLHRALMRPKADANAEVASVAARNPVWLAWRLRVDKRLAPLAVLPAARAIVIAGGAIDPHDLDDQVLAILTEPTGRYLAVFAVPTATDWVVRVFDRVSGARVTSIPVLCEGAWGEHEQLLRCMARSKGALTLASLGFSRAQSFMRRADRSLQSEAIGDLVVTRRRLAEDSYESDVTVDRARTL